MTKLTARRLNHGQCEVVLDHPSPYIGLLASNEVLSVVRRHSAAADYDAFHAALYESVGAVATFEGVSAATIAAELETSIDRVRSRIGT